MHEKIQVIFDKKFTQFMMGNLSSFKRDKPIYDKVTYCIKLAHDLRMSDPYKCRQLVDKTFGEGFKKTYETFYHYVVIPTMVESSLIPVSKQFEHEMPKIAENQKWKIISYLVGKNFRICPLKYDDFTVVQYIGKSGDYYHAIGDGSKILILTIDLV
jgi:hypothetical protein